MNYNLKGKVAIITGAGGSICGEIAKSLASEGVSVAILDISINSACRRRDEIISQGEKAIAIECDVTKREKVLSSLEQTLTEYNTGDILINCAGGGRKETTTSSGVVCFISQTFRKMCMFILYQKEKKLF